MATESITSTLASGQVLTISYQASFGEIIIAGLLLCGTALLVLDLVKMVVHR